MLNSPSKNSNYKNSLFGNLSPGKNKSPSILNKNYKNLDDNIEISSEDSLLDEYKNRNNRFFISNV